jgi:hypothetical protein
MSRDGTCGGSKGLKCLGSGFGDYYSSLGNCSSSASHCEAGCQGHFRKCTVGGVAILVFNPLTRSKQKLFSEMSSACANRIFYVRLYRTQDTRTQVDGFSG